MIRKVILRRFKRFSEETFEFPGHIVLAGPNNTGKTTVLQAIAAWEFALNRWQELNDFHKHNGAYTKAAIARPNFAAVPLRGFDLLWHGRSYNRREPIEIEIQSEQGWRLAMEFIPDSSEQIYVRPKRDVSAKLSELSKSALLPTIYIPPMTGLSTQEPVYTPQKQQDLLGQGKPGDIIRNLILAAHQQQSVWENFRNAIQQLFGYEVLPPNATGAHIIAEYQIRADGPRFDIASAGSGFQQVLMLLAFLYTHPASVLLLDEPDAHLHVILQDTIYSKLRAVASQRNSQLIISTHSEVIIDSVEPRELCMLVGRPKVLANKVDRERLVRALRVLTNTDIMLALESPGVLYVEGHTDLSILREWAHILHHPLYPTLLRGIFWRSTVSEQRLGGRGCTAREHFEALQLVNPDIHGIELIDGDANANLQSTPFEPNKLQKQRWQRYEIESYLFHPAALARYVEQTVGPEIAPIHLVDLQQYLADNLPPAVIREPLEDNAFLKRTKARTELIPPALSAAGLLDIPYTRYYEIAAVMLPEEIHPEVKEKLDAIQQAFGV